MNNEKHRNIGSVPQNKSEGKTKLPTFNADKLGNPQLRFVLWIDIMGMKGKMSRSLPQSANFMGKFHVILQRRAKQTRANVYPVMDGAYILFSKAEVVRSFVRVAFSDLAELFVSEKENEHRFLVRGGVSHGFVFIPRCFTQTASREFAAIARKNRIVMGFPVIQAHEAEAKAPPFGVFVHETARGAFGRTERFMDAFSGSWHHWKPHNPDRLIKAVEEYFTWHRAATTEMDYPIDRIDEHRQLFLSYFRENLKNQAKTETNTPLS